MAKTARKGDTIKISCPHGTQVGIITSGSNTRAVDNIPCARLSDNAICCSCGGSGNIITGSNTNVTDNLAVARVGDQEIGTCQPGCKTCNHTHNGEIKQGSHTVFTD